MTPCRSDSTASRMRKPAIVNIVPEMVFYNFHNIVYRRT